MAAKTVPPPTAKGVALGVLGHIAYQAATTPPASSAPTAAKHAASDAMDTTADDTLQSRLQAWKTEVLNSPPNVNDEGWEPELEDVVSDTR